MFRGQFVHAVDAKGRVSLPARLREPLAGSDPRFVLTPAPFDPCLHLYPMAGWEELERRIAELPSMDPHIVRFRRIYVSAAMECELDRAGRLLVPQELRERIGLDKEALWAGMGRLVELWSRQRWEQALQITEQQQAEFRQAVLEQIRI